MIEALLCEELHIFQLYLYVFSYHFSQILANKLHFEQLEKQLFRV